MEGAITIQSLMQHLQEHDLMIAPRSLVESNLKELEVQKMQRAIRTKKSLTFKEIADARLWGAINAKAAKEYAKKYAKPGEIFETSKGKITRYKIIRAAVERIAKQRGMQWE
jgi:hypothetical protein